MYFRIKTSPFYMNILNYLIFIIFYVFSVLIFVSCEDSPQSQLSEEEYAVFDLINQYREEIGLSPLTLHMGIVDQCRIHSQNMADEIIPFSHEGLDERGQLLIEKYQFSTIAENVGQIAGFDDPVKIVVQEWIISRGHRANIEGDYIYSGVGVIKSDTGTYYFTQIFAK